MRAPLPHFLNLLGFSKTGGAQCDGGHVDLCVRAAVSQFCASMRCAVRARCARGPRLERAQAPAVHLIDEVLQAIRCQPATHLAACRSTTRQRRSRRGSWRVVAQVGSRQERARLFPLLRRPAEPRPVAKDGRSETKDPSMGRQGNRDLDDLRSDILPPTQSGCVCHAVTKERRACAEKATPWSNLHLDVGNPDTSNGQQCTN